MTQPSSGDSKRVFLCTKLLENIDFDLKYLPESDRIFPKADRMLLPLAIYSIRWNIEVSYYEQKTFWPLGDYKLRSQTGMERLVNLLILTTFANHLEIRNNDPNLANRLRALVLSLLSAA